jgi:spore coat protein U-like protein
MPIRRVAYGWLVALAVSFAVAGSAAAAPRCSILSSTGMNFGKYRDNAPNALDSTGFIAFRCDEVGPAGVVMIQLSRGAGNSFTPRVMRGPSARFEYNLYLDAARTVVWGDGTSGTSDYRAVASEGTLVTIPVYGRVTPRQSVRSGIYRDTVIVTLLF